MAENKELNLGGLLTTKKYEIKSAEDRAEETKIINTALDFGEKFTSGVLIDIPAAEKKVFTQANLEDDRFEAGMLNQELLAKTAYLNDRKKDLDFVSNYENYTEGFKALAKRNWLKTPEGKKFTANGGLDAYNILPYQTNKDFKTYFDDFITAEGLRLEELYQPFIEDPDLIVNLQADPRKLSQQYRNALYSETYDKADQLYSLTTFLKNKLGNSQGNETTVNYLVDETENKIKQWQEDTRNFADFNTSDNATIMGSNYVVPFKLGKSYNERLGKLKGNFKNLESDLGKRAIEDLGHILPNNILILDLDDVSGSLLSREERDTYRDSGKVSTDSQNIFYNLTTSGWFNEDKGDKLRQSGLDIDADRLVRVRQKQTGEDGQIIFVEQDITLAEALISDVALGAEFFRHRDLNNSGLALVQQNDAVGNVYERRYVDLLVESGNIWLDKNGVLYYDRPAIARDLSIGFDQDLSEGFNEADAVTILLRNQQESESISGTEFNRISLNEKISRLRELSDEFSLRKIDELNNISTEVEQQREFLINLAMPPEKLKGTLVKYTNNYFTAGELSKPQKEKLYNFYIKTYNNNEDDLKLKPFYIQSKSD